MAPSEELVSYIRAVANARGIPVEDRWIPAIELHLRTLLDAVAVVNKSELKSQEPAPRFEP